MSETKHTPGPWNLERGRYVAGSDPVKSIVCEVRPFPWAGKVESDANAMLIVSAPDMLAALRAFCDAEAHSPKSGRGELFKEAWRKARDVIKRVEGL